MTQRIILTLAQARSLQQTIGAWPNAWHFVLAVPVPLEPNILPDPERMTAALRMMDMGAQPDQIAEQLMWKPGCQMFRTLTRLHTKA